MKRIYLYLFLFSFLINVFQYANDTKILKAKEEQIQKLEQKLKSAEDSIQKYQPIKIDISTHENVKNDSI